MIILEIPEAPTRPEPYASNIDLTGGAFNVTNSGTSLIEKVILEISENADDGSINVADASDDEDIAIAAGGGLYRTSGDYDFDENVVITPSNFAQGTASIWQGSVYELYEMQLATYVANRDADHRGYDGIRSLLGITSDDGTIDADPLFGRAEGYIVSVLPAAALANGGRTYAGRMQVISALQLLYAAYVILGGGSIGASSTTTRGPVSTETERIGTISKTTSYATSSSTTSVTSVGATDRAEWLEQEALEILIGLGANVNPSMTGEATVKITKSRNY